MSEPIKLDIPLRLPEGPVWKPVSEATGATGVSMMTADPKMTITPDLQQNPGVRFFEPSQGGSKALVLVNPENQMTVFDKSERALTWVKGGFHSLSQGLGAFLLPKKESGVGVGIKVGFIAATITDLGIRLSSQYFGPLTLGDFALFGMFTLQGGVFDKVLRPFAMRKLVEGLLKEWAKGSRKAGEALKVHITLDPKTVSRIKKWVIGQDLATQERTFDLLAGIQADSVTEVLQIIFKNMLESQKELHKQVLSGWELYRDSEIYSEYSKQNEIISQMKERYNQRQIKKIVSPQLMQGDLSLQMQVWVNKETGLIETDASKRKAAPENYGLIPITISVSDGVIKSGFGFSSENIKFLPEASASSGT